MGCGKSIRVSGNERSELQEVAFNVKKLKEIDCYVMSPDSPTCSIKKAMESAKNLNLIIKQRKQSNNPTSISTSLLPVVQ
jgi:hypothetical protein